MRLACSNLLSLLLTLAVMEHGGGTLTQLRQRVTHATDLPHKM
jgi:hypothetical protein